jgi:large repetitive protein
LIPTGREVKVAIRRLVGLAVSFVLLTAGMVLLPIPHASAATPPVSLTKSGPTTTTIGSTVPYTLTASNPSSGVDQFDVSFRDVLPPGVAYASGSTQPSDVDEPTIVAQPDGSQVLVWQDSFDLPAGASNSITFQVTFDPDIYPVGSDFADTATAYASTDPRNGPAFDSGGNLIPDPNVTESNSSTADTEVAALKVTKNEPSPEGKPLRGVHDHTTVYTLNVSGGTGAATDNVEVTDYIPAAMEFLGCGGVDNTTTGVEYPGAPSLTATPAVGANCPTPVSVDTVSNPAGFPPGVYTEVVWNLGTLAASATATIRYAAGVPLRANTLRFPGGQPAPDSLLQEANLDNNIGPSTRQNGTAVGLTNHVEVTGDYTGDVAAGASSAVDVTASHTVTVNDLRIVKSVSPSQFEAGQIATYTLQIDASEYVNADHIVVTDTLPNGICPLDATTNYVTGSPPDCDPTGPGPSVPYNSVTQNSDGTFTVVFDPIDVPHNGSRTITYQARMRRIYTGGSLAGNLTAEGDSFTNHVTETATTRPRTDVDTGESGAATVTDSSSATLTSAGGAFSKEMQPRTTPQDCTANTYSDPADLTLAQRTFEKGDRICFEITVGFPDFNATVNPIVADYLPTNLAYVAGSERTGPDNTLPNGEINFSQPSGGLVWQLGAPQSNGNLVVQPNSVFQVRFAATVTAAAPGSAPASYRNIAKMRVENSTGTIRAFRATAPFQVDPAPTVSILKGVQSINGQPAGGNPPNVDHQQVHEGDQVVFRVDQSNSASSPVPVQSLQTWNVLPARITCAQVSAITNSGACTNPGNPNQPNFAGRSTLSAIVWNAPATQVLDPGASVTYTYTVTIPTGTSVDSDLVDTASVRSFDATTNVPGTATYFPANNVDTTVPAADQDAPAASDSSDVFLAPVQVTKSVTSAINEPGNVGGETPPGGSSTQATIGEAVTFTIGVTLPANATVYDGTLSDALPSGIALLSASASGLPPGSTFDSSTGKVVLPATFDNTSANPVVFTVTIIGRVTTAGSNTAGKTLTNTATFASNRTSGGAAVTPRSATANVVVVEPKPAISKTASPTSVVGGQTVNYTLTASNAASASVLHDAWVVDCVPTQLTFNAYGTPTQGSTVPASPGAGSPCASGTTQLSWNVGDLAPGASARLTYTATVTPTAVGGQTYTNTATLTGDSLAGARTGPTDPGALNGRLYTTKVNRTITVLGASLTKTADPVIDTIGQTVTYTVTATLNANVTYFNLSAIDTLPAGLDPNSLSVVSQNCVNHDGSTCTLPPGVPMTLASAGSATKAGLFFGDVAGINQDRIITVVYSVRVADVPAAAAGVTLTNSAHLSWNLAAGPPPANAGVTFDRSSPSASAPITVVEPSMSIAKTVDDTTVEPGQTFTYTVRATNANTATTSAAYNVAVTDKVPAGVVVDPLSISAGGVLVGADGNGAGGTITWTVAGPVNPGDSLTFTYRAILGPSGTLTTAQQVNSAQVAGYDSLPSGGRHYPATAPAKAPVTPLFPAVQATKSTPLGDRAFVGESFTWKITLTNTGGGTAYQVSASDTLPPNWTYDSNSAVVSLAGGTGQQIDPDIDPSTGVLQWSGLGPLPPGANITITYTATPTPDVATSPGVGLTVNQVNSVDPGAQDITGATHNASGPYAGPEAQANAHIAASDVELKKTATTAPIAGGRRGVFTITVTNHGPDPASGVVVTDGFNQPSPAGTSNIIVTGTGWTCTGTPFACVRSNTSEAPLAAGASYPPITVTYQVASDVDDGTIIANQATVSSRTFDTNLDNNSDEASTTVGTQADLAISKSRTSPGVIAGQPVTYAVAVTNLGPSVSAGPFTVTDTLPPTSTFVSANGNGWACDPIAAGTVGATLTCTHADSLAVGDVTQDLVVTVGVPSSQTGAVVNTVEITNTTTPDPNTANNTATVTDAPTISADLQIQKRHIGAFVAGNDATYEFTVRNHGPSDAADATITDTLPAGLTFVSASGTGWTCSPSGQDVTCTHPTPLPSGTTTVVQMTVHLASTATTPITNTATVNSTTPDPDTTNNTDGDETDVNQLADLAITKSHTDTAVAGSTLSYTLHVTNTGPSQVPGSITVTDPLPDGLTYQSATGTGWACTYASASRLVTCVSTSGLDAGQAASDITLTVGIEPNAGPATIVNPADVTSATDDPDLSNNHTEDPTAVIVQSNIQIAKTLDTPTPVEAGTNVTFTLAASNSGPSDATQVVVTDPLPDHLNYVSADGTGWTCTHAGQTVICRRPVVAAVPPGAATPPITLVAQVDPSLPFDPPDAQVVLTNTASIDMASPGTVGPPSSADVPVVARADLALAKDAIPATPTAGHNFVWRMTAHNNGPSDAAAPLTLTDELPAYQTYVSAAPPWNCTAGPPPATPTDRQSVTCTLDASLAAGADAPILRMLVHLSADAPSTREVNTADVSSPTPGDPGHAIATVNVRREAKLTIDKSHSGNGQVGQTVAFRIDVGNKGPSTADQVVVTDPLPTGLTYVSASGPDWTCSNEANDVRCELAGTLAVGATAPPITLTAKVGASAYPSTTNVATVFSTDPDLPSRASDADPLTVDPDTALKLAKHHQGTFEVGQEGTYLLTVINNGPTPSPGPIRVTDTLPNGLTYVSATGTEWKCSAKGVTVTCVRHKALPVHGSSSITLKVLVGPAAVPSVTNTATTSAPGAQDNSASDTAPVKTRPSESGVLPFTGLDAAELVAAAILLISLGMVASSRGGGRTRRHERH